jgi:hypothetical protein
MHACRVGLNDLDDELQRVKALSRVLAVALLSETMTIPTDEPWAYAEVLWQHSQGSIALLDTAMSGRETANGQA